MIDAFIQAAQTEVDNHSIYVWGGSGQLCCDVSEEWIRKQEARNERGKHADDAVEAWEAVMASPYREVARCFDCSGFVSWCLIKAGASERRRDCDGLFARSTEIYTPEDGCLLFRVNPAKPSDETHVGIYYNGNQYEARGRKDGVVCLPYNEQYWQKLAWFKAMKPDPKPEPPKPEPTGQVVKVVGKSVWVRDRDSTKGKKLFIAHSKQWYREHGQARDSDTFPLLGVAPSGWYHVRFRDRDGFITNLAKYTTLEG